MGYNTVTQHLFNLRAASSYILYGVNTLKIRLNSKLSVSLLMPTTAVTPTVRLLVLHYNALFLIIWQQMAAIVYFKGFLF